MIYGCVSSFIYDYNDDGNITFHIYGYSFKKKNKKPANCSRELSWSSLAFWPQAPVQNLSLFADLLSFTGCSIPWIKMSHLCHSAMCHVCPQTIPFIHHRGQLPWCHINISDGRLSECLDGCFFAHLVIEQLLRVLRHPSSARTQPSRAAHTALSLADWLLSRAAGEGKCEAVLLCIYIVIITLMAWLQADQTVGPN